MNRLTAGARNGSARPEGVDLRLPPQNLVAEQGVIGGVLLDEDALREVLPLLRPEHFYRDSHRIFWSGIVDVFNRHGRVDGVMLAEELIRRGEYERAGGDEALAEACASVPHAANARYYADIVRQKWVKREILSICHEVAGEVYRDALPASTLAETLQSRALAVTADEAIGTSRTLRESLDATMRKIEARTRGEVSGLRTGFVDLDETIGGLHPKQLVVLAARPSIGKTALAMNIAEHVAVDQGRGVLIVSLEMSDEELCERIMVSRSRTPGGKVMSGAIGPDDLARLRRAKHEIERSRLVIDDSTTRTVSQIYARALREAAGGDLALVIVDYLGRITPEGDPHHGGKQYEILGKITGKLKDLARDIACPVLLLSQLNRQVENRDDREPMLHDLRGSGDIEQDADVVMLLHRPEFYDPDKRPGEADLIVAKNRNGETGIVRLAFLKEIVRFENFCPIPDDHVGAPGDFGGPEF